MIQIDVPRRILIDLQVFGQELFGEDLTIKFSLKLSLLLFEVRDTHIYRPIASFQNGLKRCVFSKKKSEIFSLVIDYRILVIDYTVIF